MQTYPPKLKKLLDACNIPAAVLLSLTIQILLIILGNRRKINSKGWVRFVIWSAYLSADTVATFALGLISNKLTNLYDDEKNAGYEIDAKTELAAFWAPFLILHMGGTDSITAYALEDNELWLRQLLGLVSQTVIGLSVFLMAFTSSSSLSFLSIPMLLVGVIKCGERICALRSASTEEDKVNPSSETSLFKNELKRKSNAGYAVAEETSIDVPFQLDLLVNNENSNSSIPEQSRLVIAAYMLLNITKRLLSDSILTTKSKYILRSVCRNLPLENLFQLIETELGLMYDFFYTKSTLYTLWGFSLRLITLFITSLTFILFFFTTFLAHRKKYSMFDISLTIVLIVVAIILELYSALLMLSSEWFLFRLSVYNKKKVTSILQAIKRSPNRQWWPNNMSQLSIVTLLSDARPLPCSYILQFSPLNYMLWEAQWYSSQKQVPKDLKKLIVRYFQNRVEEISINTNQQSLKDVNNSFAEEFERDKYFDFVEDLGKIILFWHTVTEVSYHLCLDQMKNQGDSIVAHCELIKELSRYMLYLLLQPSVLSFGEIYPMSLQETLEKYRDLVRGLKDIEVCEALIRPTEKEATNRSLQNVLEEAFALAKEIKSNYDETNSLEKWNTLLGLWLKLIEYGARNYSTGRRHAQHLRDGGEFVSHVWLLMTHLGLTDHFQISETSHTGLVII